MAWIFRRRDSRRERTEERRHRENIGAGERQRRTARRWAAAAIVTAASVAIWSQWPRGESAPEIAAGFEFQGLEALESLLPHGLDSFAVNGVILNLSDGPFALTQVDFVVAGKSYETEWATPGNCLGDLAVLGPGEVLPLQMFVGPIQTEGLSQVDTSQVELHLHGADGETRSALFTLEGQTRSQSQTVHDLGNECRSVLGF